MTSLNTRNTSISAPATAVAIPARFSTSFPERPRVRSINIDVDSSGSRMINSVIAAEIMEVSIPSIDVISEWVFL